MKPPIEPRKKIPCEQPDEADVEPHVAVQDMAELMRDTPWSSSRVRCSSARADGDDGVARRDPAAKALIPGSRPRRTPAGPAARGDRHLLDDVQQPASSGRASAGSPAAAEEPGDRRRLPQGSDLVQAPRAADDDHADRGRADRPARVDSSPGPVRLAADLGDQEPASRPGRPPRRSRGPQDEEKTRRRVCRRAASCWSKKLVAVACRREKAASSTYFR